MKSHNLSASGKGSVAVLLICVVVMLFTVVFSGVPLNHDSALLLQCGQLISEGSVPFVNHIETNIHMAQYIHVPPVVLSNILGIELPQLFVAGVVLLTVLICYAVFLLVRKSGLFHTRTGVVLVSSSILILSLKAYSMGFLGQREHLFILAWLPFILIRYFRMQDIGISTVIAALTGIFAGIMMLCKPSFFAQAFLIEVLMGFRLGGKRTYRTPEMYAVYFVGIAFAFHLFLLPGSIKSPFFTRWIPFIVSGYHAYNAPILGIIGEFRQYWYFFLGAAVFSVSVMLKSDRTTRRFLELLLAASIIATGLFLLQQKGWPYQLFPAFGSVTMLITTAAAVTFERINPGEKKREWVNAALLTGITAACFVFSFSSFKYAKSAYSGMGEFLKIIELYSDPGERISFISTSVYPKYPTLIYADRLPGTRFMSAFPIALFYSDVENSGSVADFCYRVSADMPVEEVGFLEELGEDIQDNRPALVFLDAREQCQGCPEGFRIIDYLRHSGWMDKYMEEYSFLTSCGEFETYSLN